MGDSPPHSLVSPEVAQALCLKAAATPPGCFIEVGVYHGGTAWHLAKVAQAQDRDLYLYDTYTGIPYAEAGLDSHVVGDFANTTIEEVQRDVPWGTCVAGIFPTSALDMGPIAFVHLDCDQYQSYKDALEYLKPRMVAGGVVWMDDADCLNGAARAVREFCQATGMDAFKAEKVFFQF